MCRRNTVWQYYDRRTRGLRGTCHIQIALSSCRRKLWTPACTRHKSWILCQPHIDCRSRTQSKHAAQQLRTCPHRTPAYQTTRRGNTTRPGMPSITCESSRHFHRLSCSCQSGTLNIHSRPHRQTCCQHRRTHTRHCPSPHMSLPHTWTSPRMRHTQHPSDTPRMSYGSRHRRHS